MGQQLERGAAMAAEIDSQPEVLSALLHLGASRLDEAASRIADRSPRFVLLAARGNSDHAAQYAKYLVEVCLGLPAGMASPSTMTAYGARPDLSDVLMIGISAGGEAEDLLETLQTARAGGATTVAITNEPGAALAQAAELNLDLMAGPENSGATTKTYTAALMALWLLVDRLRGGDGSAAAPVPDAVAAMLARREEVAALAARYRFTDRLVTTGRGYSYPTAREAALKLMETCNVAAHAFSGADLLHGPLAMIDRDHPVLAFVPNGLGAQAMRPVLERLAERGADVAVLGGSDSTELATVALDVGGADVLEELHPIVDIVAAQMLALEMALARGLDPGAPHRQVL